MVEGEKDFLERGNHKKGRGRRKMMGKKACGARGCDETLIPPTRKMTPLLAMG